MFFSLSTFGMFVPFVTIPHHIHSVLLSYIYNVLTLPKWNPKMKLKAMVYVSTWMRGHLSSGPGMRCI